MPRRYLISSLAGLGIAVLLFLIIQGLVVGRQFQQVNANAAASEALVNLGGLPGLNVSRGPSGLPVRPQALGMPPLPQAAALAAVQPPAIPAPSLEMPVVDIPFNPAGTEENAAPVVAGPAAGASGGGSEAGTAAAPAPIRAGDLVLMQRVEPQYPIRALQQGIQGSVTLSFTVQTDGSVSDPRVMSAKPRRGIFDDAAMRAVLRWKFKPIGAPQQTQVTLVFNLGQGQ